jgi:ABC-type branched-subunit amino acid transport system ATPase component/predicted MFS family arabinose efflux permease
MSSNPRRPPRLTDSSALLPLVVVTGLGSVMAMTPAVFALSFSGVEDAYHLGLPVLFLLLAQRVQLGLGLDLPVALVANRTSRSRTLIVVGVGFTALTVLLWYSGLVANQVLLYIAVIGVVIGSGALTSTQNALLSESYPLHLRPRAIFIQRSVIVVGLSLCPPIVTILALLFGWQAPFLALAAAAAVFIALATRLPTRPGVAEGFGDTTSEPEAEPATLPEAARALFTTPSLRLLFYSMPFLVSAVLGLTFYLNLYFENVFHQDAASRALLFGLAEPGAVVGLLIAFRVLPRRTGADPAATIRVIAVLALVAAAAAALLALAPDVATAFVAQVAFVAASAIVVAGLYSVLSVALPTRMITLGFALSTVWLQLGVVLIAPSGVVGSSLDGLITNAFGYRASMWIFVPLLAVGAALLGSSSRFVTADIERRQVSEEADAVVRRARAEGTAQLLMVRSLDAGYQGVQVLFGIDFEVADGEMLAVLGTNGAGKSTLMRAISGLVVPSAGEVLFDGKAITTYEAHRIAEAGILHVPGGRGIFPGLTVSECLRVAGWLYDQDPAGLAADTEKVLGYFPVLERRLHTLAGSLSGGEQQMLSLSMAFIAKPRLLIIDELSLGLAPTVIENLLGIVTTIHEQGTAVLLVEQSVNLALRLCQRAIFIEKGRVVFSGATVDLLDRQDIVRAVLLGAHPELPRPHGPLAPYPARSASVPLARAPNGVRTAAPGRRSAPSKESNGAVLSARGLYQRFGGVVAVDHVDLDLYDGEILGLLGPNGAGKTTVFELLSGERRVEQGRVTMGDLDISSWPAYRRAAHGLGRSFQAARLWPGLTVHESVMLAISQRLPAPGTPSALLCLPTVRRAERRLRQAADEVLEPLGLGPYSDQLTSDLSTGLRRLLELAVIVALGPSIVLLDEPSAGLAQAETEAMAPVLLETKARLGCSMMLIEHDMGLLRRLADRAIALDTGTVVATGDPDEVLNHPRVVESYLGAATV